MTSNYERVFVGVGKDEVPEFIDTLDPEFWRSDECHEIMKRHDASKAKLSDLVKEIDEALHRYRVRK